MNKVQKLGLEYLKTWLGQNDLRGLESHLIWTIVSLVILPKAKSVPLLSPLALNVGGDGV